MPRPLAIALVLLGTPMTLPGAFAMAEPPAPATPATTFSASRVIVEWEPGVSRGDRAEAREDAEVSLQANLGDPKFQLVKIESGQTVTGAIEELEADPAVAVAERDSLRAPNSIPDDPLLGQLWGLQNSGAGIDGFPGATAGADIDAPGAWTRTVGTPSTVVADIDSGYRFGDPDLGPVAWENPGEIPGNGLDDDGNGYVDDVHGYDFVGSDADHPSEDDDPTDDNLVSGGHGLHTAGTIGAAGNNGVGITGVAQDIRLMPLRVCANSALNSNEGRCPLSSIVAAINYAGANGARVANISLGGTSSSTIELDAFASNPQTLYVISAGNDAANNDLSPHYPCDYEPEGSGINGAIDNIACVAATNQADALASFSDWGSSTVDLGAPGTEILSTYPAEEDLLGEGFEGGDFESKWSATGADGGFAATSEAPLTSTGMSDSPGAAPGAGSIRESILTTGFSVPSGYGACQFSGRRFVSLGGGILTQTVYSDGEAVFQSKPPNTAGAAMVGFATVPITELAGSSIRIRFRYEAGGAPTGANGVWLDDLKLTCHEPVDAPLTYKYLQGTSMAAPHVTGTAALLFSIKPAATVTQVRQALLASVDPDPSLAGKTVTGGRLDAAQAIGVLVDPPPAPLLTATDPASPANENHPQIIGSAEAGSSIRIFSGAACNGSPVAEGTAGELESPGLVVAVLDDSTTQLSATATSALLNTSSCSTPISYTERSTPPPAPSLTSTDPTSPANENEPRIVGSAEAGSNVTIYAGSACEGTPVASGSAAELASPGIAVSVPDDSARHFSATAAESALNTSACSDPVSYVEDSTAPAAPVLQETDPASPANESEPRILGYDPEEVKTVSFYLGDSCAGATVGSGSGAELNSPTGIAITVPDNSVNEISARASDAALNLSDCSDPIAYTEDSIPPAAPVLESTSPASPAADAFPRIVGSAENSSSIAIYSGATCKGAPEGTGTAAQLGSPGIVVNVPAASTLQFSARATDAAHNTSTCAGPISYTNSTPVGPPIIVIGPPDESMLRIPPLEPATTAIPIPPVIPSCTVPKLAGKPLAQAKAALGSASCHVGKVTKPRARRGHAAPALVVKSSSPGPGAVAPGAVVNLTLGPKPKKHHH